MQSRNPWGMPVALRPSPCATLGGSDMPDARLTVWGEAECRRLHEATLELLADTGVDVRYEPALALFSAAGASIDGRRVRIPRATRGGRAGERAARVAAQAARR